MRFIAIECTLALCVLAVGCGGSTEFPAQGLAAAPEAEMEVEMSRTFAGNHPMTVEIDELPPPEQLGARRYAVWTLRHGAAAPQLEGYLAYDHDARHGRLETVTPYDQLTVIVTAERTGTPRTPSEVVIAERAIDYPPV